MLNLQIQPLIFEPSWRTRVWGGDSLSKLFGRAAPADAKGPIGESWELADLESHDSVVAVGPAKGRTLSQLVDTWGTDLLGRAGLVDGRFPLLIKFLDARQSLSVQVHPTPETARRLGGDVRAKDEAWYVVHAEPGAVIYHDLRPGVGRRELQDAVAANLVPTCLRSIPAKAGQCIWVPSGTVHALGAGIVVAEVQTPSDTTLRLYDWGRLGTDGRPRALQVEQALDSIRFGRRVDPCPPRSHVAGVFTTVSRLLSTEFFCIEKVRFSGGIDQEIPYAELVIWIVLSGDGSVAYGGGSQTIPFRTGDTVVLPAALKNGRVRTESDCVWLEVTIPIPSDLADFPHPSADQLQTSPETGGLPILRGGK